MTADSAASDRPASGQGDADTERKVPLVNIANALTTSRLLLVPVFLIVLFWAGGHDSLWRWVATAVFVVASVTDRIDGDLARRRGLITDFGKIADPLADKALTGAALVGLSALGDLGWWVTGVIIFREASVTLLRFWVIRHGVIPASPGGKLKTMLQAVAIGLYLLPLGDAADPLKWVVMGAAVLATVVTGVDYAVRALRLRSSSPRSRGVRA
ncbi:CDP-diacylglycerol--glycerol-3-phosphate 3-phosphatidyltransferase [Actinopolyspora alba]|uniref:CDP-diacylglycerol--glycerol-3-phosphate 3-phosphatidyltransferase n=1 Tax=Actinopolyspora alba TaxID=673379 RepID=A0A1I1V9J5_9ACTN|nr:CDP-diacylglycerol--glycerol-3-phosphate 3-phosphatidyltransferase [Actinopolyspora alba]SFD77773.1 CDP-diacylglycerol--glycerol-3-phosphate 3-phosphatidyltransferase [Actinopolyspora alba]